MCEVAQARGKGGSVGWVLTVGQGLAFFGVVSLRWGCRHLCVPIRRGERRWGGIRNGGGHRCRGRVGWVRSGGRGGCRCSGRGGAGEGWAQVWGA